MACEKQKEEGSCGINTKAFATALAYGLNPCELRFDLSQLRPHLIHCVSKGTLDLFPTIGKRVRSNWRPRKLCPCPSLAFSACPTLETQNFFQKNSTTWCNAKFAKKYFHQECENVPKSTIECKKVPWFCSICWCS